MTDRVITFRDAINEAMRLEMRRDPNVVLIGEDVAGGARLSHIEGEGKEAWGGVMGVSHGLVQEFGRERVLDTPISESAFIGAAMTAAATGLRPIAELMFVDFLGVCMDQIFNQGAKLRYMFGGKARVPVTIRTMIGAGARAAGQHSGCHYSVFTHMPGLKTVVPSTPADAKGLLAAAIRDDDPVIFFEHKVLYNAKGPVPEGEYVIPLGKADIKRTGTDLTIIAVGRMVMLALEAAERLAREHSVEAEVVDPRTLSPLDTETLLQSIRKTHRLVVVDEDNPRCSIAGDLVTLAATQAFDFLDGPPQVVTAPHAIVPFSPALEDLYVPSASAIVRAAQTAMGLPVSAETPTMAMAAG
ncbi:MAG: alpha-ketoacid dehydrogenase subunit beta [Chloroflexi bacterium]|nr:alpha-ketoacid dehydrogenase subunit beta [Chloroflexota bacterium]